MLKKRYKICLFVFSVVVLSLLAFAVFNYEYVTVSVCPPHYGLLDSATGKKPLSYEEQEAKRLFDEQQAILAEEYERQEAAKNESTPLIP
ncbi:MAG: hypothetical protein LBC20_05175 [Planctomycetaceae bacterium]|jgi:hypothetical protein|nr:hypothetical protein [Planctomycetaceae bacterium]